MPESTAVINELEKLNNSIEEHINRIIRRIENAPAGSLRIINKGQKHQYYHRIDPSDPQGKYIPRKYHSVAVSLAQKDYDKKLLKILNRHQELISVFLSNYDAEAAQNVYKDLREPRRALVTPEFLSDEAYIKKWLAMPYKKLGFKNDIPEYYTAKGERVRSKSEILIADALFRHNIPYRYEYPLYSNGVLIAAPDFNCLNVRLRKEFYWEHLGRLGDKDYCDHIIPKFERYTLAESFEETSLIFTFETEHHPLNTKVIEAKIRKYLI